MKKRLLVLFLLTLTPGFSAEDCFDDCDDYCTHQALEYAGTNQQAFLLYFVPCYDGCIFGCNWDEMP